MVERVGLENQCASNGTVGSNPTLSDWVRSFVGLSTDVNCQKNNRALDVLLFFVHKEFAL